MITNRFRLKQWHIPESVEEATERFNGGIDEYFQHHLNQIKEDGRYRIVTSSKTDKSFFIEITDGTYHTVKCTAELL